MNVVTNIFGSSLGKKYIMAVSGGVLFLFVIGHLLGNLQIFLGAEAINRYGHFLQTNLELIWPARIVLLLMLGLHVWSAIKLSAENKAARPESYTNWNPTVATYASRTMLMSGLIVFVFIVYHLLHYTVMLQAVNFSGRDFTAKPEFYDALGRHDIFKMMVVGFHNPWVSSFYILGVGLLCLHLSHGVSAMFQSLGWKSKTCTPCLDCASRAMAIAIFVGYSAIPIAIVLGYGQEALK